MENNYLKIKSKVYKCGDLDGEITYTFNNKISCISKGNFCIPIAKSKYDDGSFIQLAFTKHDLTKKEQIKHLINIQNYKIETAEDYFKNYENFYFKYEEKEIYIFKTEKDFKKSGFSTENCCILEKYELDYKYLPILKENLILDFPYGSQIQWNLWFLKKITCNKNFNLLILHSVDGDSNENYIDGTEKELKKEIENIKKEINDLGISKKIIDKYSDDFEIDFEKIKTELMFQKIKKSFSEQQEENKEIKKEIQKTR